MVEQVRDLVRRGGRIDPDGDAGRGHDPEVTVQPLGTILGEHGDVVVGPQAEGHERRGDTIDLLRIAAPRDPVPDAIFLEPDGQCVATRGDLRREQLGKRAGSCVRRHQRLLFRYRRQPVADASASPTPR